MFVFRMVPLISLLFVLTFSPACGEEEIPSFHEEEIVGEYYYGDGRMLNAYLNLLPDGTFRYKSWIGNERDGQEQQGRYGFENGELVLLPPKRSRWNHLTPVRWDGRIYLVPNEGYKNDFVSFLNKINQGLEPRKAKWGFVFLRTGDERKPVNGPPELPVKWREYILDDEVTGSILSIDEQTLTVQVDVGSRQGMKPGMELHTSSERMLTVTHAEEERSFAKLEYGHGKVAVGDKVTTRTSEEFLKYMGEFSP